MKFGFFLSPFHVPGDNITLAYERDLETIAYAEKLDFDEFWIGEHHTSGWECIPAPDIFIAAAAQRTHRIRLGTGVVNLPYHDPFHVSERIAFLDHLTRGRLSFGIGSGILPTDHLLFGIEREDIAPRMAESLEIILKLFREDGPVSHEGKYWTIKDRALMVKPYQKPHTPIAIATTGGPNSTGLCVKHGLQLLSAAFMTPPSGAALREQWEGAAAQAAEHGHTLRRDDWRISTYVYLAETKEKAIADVQRGLESEQRGFFKPLVSKLAGVPFDPDAPLNVPAIIEQHGWIVTDPGECIEWLKRLDREAGGLGGLLIIANDWASPENWRRSMELFARYVMPEFRHWGRSTTHAWQRMMEFLQT